MKKKLLFILFILFIFTGCGKNIATISEKTTTFEYGKDIYLSDIISITNGTFTDKLIKYNNLGKKKLTINYTDTKNNKGTYNITINIVDTTSPIIKTTENIYVIKDSTPDLVGYIFCADNETRNLVCNVEGNYDTSIIGEYPLKFTSTDNSLNYTEEKFTLHVIEAFNKQNNLVPEYDKIEDIISKHKTKDTNIGIDVSYHNGNINWEKVKNSGVSFAMIRIGLGPDSNNKMVIDKKFRENIKEAKKNKIKVGVYFFSYATTLKEANTQANWVVKTLKKEKLDLPIVYDWESWTGFYGCGINLYDLNKVYDEFATTIKTNGYQSMIYGSKNYLNMVWNTKNKKVWLAHYTDYTDYDKHYMMWQLTENGSVPGIDGAVDIDVLYK